MPVSEQLRTAATPLDLESEEPNRGLAGLLVGDVRGSTNKGFLGHDATVGALTGVAYATGAGATKTFSLTFTKPADVAKAEVFVYDADDEEFIVKADQTATGTFTNSALAAATVYTIRLKPIATDGHIGEFQSSGTVTTHA